MKHLQKKIYEQRLTCIAISKNTPKQGTFDFILFDYNVTANQLNSKYDIHRSFAKLII